MMVWAKRTLSRFSGGLFMVRMMTLGSDLEGSTVRWGKGGEDGIDMLGVKVMLRIV